MKLNSLELKFLLTADISNKDVSTIFVSWAIKGYIKLTYDDGLVVLFKQRDISPNERKYEISFFKKLFANENTIYLNDLYGTLYPEYQKIIYSVKKRTNSLNRSLVFSILKLLTFILMLMPYYVLMTVVTNGVCVISVIVALFYMIPHSFMAYNTNLILHKIQKVSTITWSIIIFLLFVVSMIGIASVADIAILVVLIHVLISFVFTILNGFITFKQSTSNKYYLLAKSIYNKIVNKTYSEDNLLMHVLVLDLYNLYTNETQIESIHLRVNTDSSIQNIYQLVQMLGLHLAPNPLPSGNVSASSQ